jgi:hypothetical protein
MHSGQKLRAAHMEHGIVGYVGSAYVDCFSAECFYEVY